MEARTTTSLKQGASSGDYVSTDVYVRSPRKSFSCAINRCNCKIKANQTHIIGF